MDKKKLYQPSWSYVNLQTREPIFVIMWFFANLFLIVYKMMYNVKVTRKIGCTRKGAE